MSQPKSLAFRPYARLLTMLGDQLIKNERIALVELVKNAYDADGSWVKVTFEGFSAEFVANANSKIIIEDDGDGMSEDIIVNHWANPATPVKLQRKKAERPKTKKGRVIQGEKGIGRFALLKLGRAIQITTRVRGESMERVLTLDLSGYSEDFIDSEETPLFLDDLRMTLDSVEPAEVIKPRSISLGLRTVRRPGHGTRIEIRHLTSRWSQKKVTEVYRDLMRLQSIFVIDGEEPKEDPDPFELAVFRNDTYEPFAIANQDKLAGLLENKRVFHVEGSFDAGEEAFRFSINGAPYRIGIHDPVLTGMRIFRDSFGSGLLTRPLESGPFEFEFYVFDFNADAKSKYLLDDDDKQLLRQHRIYLYRDGIRVYPYGDADDDWLLIDVRRGTVKASEFLSNDQVVGHVRITQAGNPDLRDKTSREGLVDTGNPTHDFRALLQIFLAWLRKEPYAQIKIKAQKGNEVTVFKTEAVQHSLDEALKAAQAPGTPAPVREKLGEASQQYKQERRYLVHRAEATEHLAGVGLSVESATHDLHMALQTAMTSVSSLLGHVQRGGDLDREVLQRELTSIRGGLAFIEDQIKDVQLLFKSTKQRRKDIKIRDVVGKVDRLFAAIARSANVDVEIRELGPPLVAKTTDAVLLQVLLNLYDNAIYWLRSIEPPRKIEILLDGDAGALIFADNGPGIRSEDIPYIFEPFYSGKGEDGRGLGLYIARQLLERQDYSIDVADRSERLLRGANLVVSFVPENDQ